MLSNAMFKSSEKPQIPAFYSAPKCFKSGVSYKAPERLQNCEINETNICHKKENEPDTLRLQWRHLPKKPTYLRLPEALWAFLQHCEASAERDAGAGWLSYTG